nr:copper resistance CopC family protein [Staphylococcus auricularis]
MTPVNAKYSGITLYDDEGNKITDLDPETEGSSATLSFSTDDVGEGTHTVEWHAMSADGHEVGDQFQFSVGEVTASDVDTSVPFYQKADFWFGVTRYLSQGALIGLIGLFWMNELVRRRDLPTYQVIPEQKGFTGILMMLTGVTLITYLMTLTSDILADIFTFKMDTITQFPFILSSLAIIILLALLMITNMMRAWYSRYIWHHFSFKYVWTCMVTKCAGMVHPYSFCSPGRDDAVDWCAHLLELLRH